MTLILFGLLRCTAFPAQGTHSDGQEMMDYGVRLRVRPEQHAYLNKQKISVSIVVSNEGSKPVYIERYLGPCPTYWGGVSLKVLDGEGRELPEARCGDPYQIDFTKRDVLMDIHDHWVPLFPGYSYSCTVSVESIPSRLGRYTILATLVPPSFTKEEQETLHSLPYPVFLGKLNAKTTVVRGVSR